VVEFGCFSNHSTISGKVTSRAMDAAFDLASDFAFFGFETGVPLSLEASSALRLLPATGGLPARLVDGLVAQLERPPPARGLVARLPAESFGRDSFGPVARLATTE
jgi:hypothetical protein